MVYNLAEATIICKWYLCGEEFTNSSQTDLPSPDVTELKSFCLEDIDSGLELSQRFSEALDKERHIVSISTPTAVSDTNTSANN